MGEILFATGDLEMKKTARDIALTADEVSEIMSEEYPQTKEKES